MELIKQSIVNIFPHLRQMIIGGTFTKADKLIFLPSNRGEREREIDKIYHSS